MSLFAAGIGSAVPCQAGLQRPPGVNQPRALTAPIRGPRLPSRVSQRNVAVYIRADNKEALVKSQTGKPIAVVEVEDTISEEISSDLDAEPEWKLKYLYDGGCTVCMSLVDMLRSRKGHENIYFEDITSPDFNPRRNKGIQLNDAMDTIHVIKKEGDIVQGMDALTLLYSEVGLGWVFRLAQLPLLSQIAEFLYRLVSKNRMALGAGMDGVMAIGRINMEANGTGQCEADGECRTKEEPQAAPAKQQQQQQQQEEEEEAEEAGGNVSEPIYGSWMDHEHVLGIYTYGLGEGLRAAPIDAATGKFLVPGFSIRLENHDFETLINAIDELISRFQWQGAIGLGLPGILASKDKSSKEWLPDTMKAKKDTDARRSKWEFEFELKEACNHDVIVMGGAEANGYGEIAYGAGKGLQGLTLMVAIGRGFGAALFDNGVLVKNISGLLSAELSTWNSDAWSDALLPDSDEQDMKKWDRYAERVENYLLKLEDFCHPDQIILGGSATRGKRFDKLASRMTKVEAPLLEPQLGQLAGVKGAGAGAADELVLRDGLAALRAAIGKSQMKSPSAMTEEDIRVTFKLFDKDGNGNLTADEVAAALERLGVSMPEHEVRELIFDMDIDNSGNVTFEEFKSFWSRLVQAEDVTLLHTLQEYENILAEESTSGRLIVLEVGFTYCKPCRKFEPAYHAFAEQFTDARFLRMNGNDNADMVTLGRDILKVRSSPSFYFFRNGEIVHRSTGGKEEKFEDAILQTLIEGEAGYVPNYEPKTFETPASTKVAANAI